MTGKRDKRGRFALKVTDEQWAALERWFHEGHTYSVLADKMSALTGDWSWDGLRVSKQLNRRGLKRRAGKKRTITAGMVDTMLRLAKDGEEYEEIARLMTAAVGFNVTAVIVSKYLVERGYRRRAPASPKQRPPLPPGTRYITAALSWRVPE